MIFLFDLFGTVFDMSGVPENELRDYASAISGTLSSLIPGLTCHCMPTPMIHS